jgi:hypothetical protein
MPRHEHQIITRRVIFQHSPDAVSDLAPQSVSLDCLCHLLADGDTNPEITRIILRIKKRKTVN